ncbi:GNAT family N-acetyltransferase [Vibrio cholerae]|uniref:GNAT family N-acetyltransferase n=1 Tax=Vibrio cholerae TaxID=666 RepID=UPI0006E4D427|nr:GNAT family protein [Vibrio cholerae]KQA38445.1 acyltransferase [Vibrio cholerae]KQA48250.1 acyltransferase [Vibrio cholerae]KQA56059.1 acyltransferase [Vibrio cholerae]KQA77391.1 acyltransferase [Vibrio cholerae]KQA79961.1 acyltransferase [Vibrio cholerae]
MNVYGNMVTLRALELDDVEHLNRWANLPELWNMLGGWHFPYSRLNTEQWVRAINNNDQKNHVFAIQTDEHGLVGTANLVNIDWKNRNAFHGMMLGDKDTRGKGYAQDAVMALMRYAFDELGMRRLDGDMIAYNKMSINFYTKRCGWEIEGIKKDWFYRSGKFHDKVIVGITSTRYYKFVEDLGYWEP